jgi:catechol 2,3-dioxygenase-like lactoylglutathione lyase family enzyme
MNARSILALTALAAAPMFAQLAAPNAAGVSMGHIHLAVKDVDAEKQFFTLLGGTPVKNGPLEMIEFPGVYILMRKAEPTGGTVGSRVNHFGFHVKSVPDVLAKLKPMGLKVEQNNPQQAFVTAPDDVRVELLEDHSISSPIEMHHIHMFVADPLEVQAWYGKLFGATPGKRGQFDTANIPGVELSLSKNEMPLVPTKGRSLDHIGFEVKDLDQFAKKVEAEGIKFDVAPRMVPNSTTKIAFITDPWGTYIELTQGLGK